MLTSSHDLPLPPVMKAELSTDHRTVKVLESDIYLELQNKKEERIVIHRTVKGQRSTDLVSVTFGPALTVPGGTTYRTEDYFVSRPGAASRERGFHKFLADFLGWSLPLVPTYDDREYLLYLQCIFPYFFVEQTRGWSTIQPPIPNQFRIREAHRRVVEFILDLDAYNVAAKRAEIERHINTVMSRWTSTIRAAEAIAKSIGALGSNLPASPVAIWPPELYPTLLLPSENEWHSVEHEISTLQKELTTLLEQELPKVVDIAETAEVELAEMQENLAEKEAIVSRLIDSLDLERAELRGIEERLEKLEEDLQRNKDVKTLLSLGSAVAPNIAEKHCPTCHQVTVDTLTPVVEGQSVMSIDENIAFLSNQKTTFGSLKTNMSSVLEAKGRQVDAYRAAISQDRTQVRYLRQTLISDGRLPSKAALRKQVETEARIERLQRSLEEFSNQLSELEELSESWNDLQSQKAQLPKDDSSQDDINKVNSWVNVFRKQLKAYDFQSLEADSISISQDNYRPSHEGFDVPNNISASDFIRVIWAYLAGLLETAGNVETNHLGLLVFDEPKQQSAKEVSFEQLLATAARVADGNSQVVFATSENKSRLDSMLQNIPHEIAEFEGRIIRKLS